MPWLMGTYGYMPFPAIPSTRPTHSLSPCCLHILIVSAHCNNFRARHSTWAADWLHLPLSLFGSTLFHLKHATRLFHRLRCGQYFLLFHSLFHSPTVHPRSESFLVPRLKCTMPQAMLQDWLLKLSLIIATFCLSCIWCQLVSWFVTVFSRPSSVSCCGPIISESLNIDQDVNVLLMLRLRLL
ncbi:hypothetical protein EDB92DRAFT_682872 [Lactarius akahatsu]|uniref:Uncharacterized protein n=1 Tax=Lactarius akahatsu TaxID=416441 RepID=A0AAD4Q7W9_9AGAM|nr:hypothetical protein EDB92DRAFT_682872 [Lactarius akahatsu]